MFYATGERRGNCYHYYYSQKQPREQLWGRAQASTAASQFLCAPICRSHGQTPASCPPLPDQPILTSGEIFLRDGGREIAQERSRAMQASLLIPALAWAQAQRWVCVCSVRRAFQWGHTRAGAHAHSHRERHTHTDTHTHLYTLDSRGSR